MVTKPRIYWVAGTFCPVLQQLNSDLYRAVTVKWMVVYCHFPTLSHWRYDIYFIKVYILSYYFRIRQLFLSGAKDVNLSLSSPRRLIGKYRYSVVSLSRESWALFPPATETLRADSWAVTCCPEGGRLTFGVWVIVVKEWKSKTISIQGHRKRWKRFENAIT